MRIKHSDAYAVYQNLSHYDLVYKTGYSQAEKYRMAVEGLEIAIKKLELNVKPVTQHGEAVSLFLDCVNHNFIEPWQYAALSSFPNDHSTRNLEEQFKALHDLKVEGHSTSLWTLRRRLLPSVQALFYKSDDECREKFLYAWSDLRAYIGTCHYELHQQRDFLEAICSVLWYHCHKEGCGTYDTETF